jgi:hypothetical protein
MIQLRLTNLKGLEKEFVNKVDGIKELTRPVIMERFSAAIFSITKRQFLIDINRFARVNPGQLSHVYEWSKVGDNRSRLFDIIKVSASPTRIIIGSSFQQSKTKVPLDPALALDGPTGKYAKSAYVFKNKAEMMESGKRVSFIAKRTVVFMDKGEGPIFRSKGQRVVHSMPEKTRGQFELYLRTWYATKVNDAIERSRIFKDVERVTATTLNVTNAGAVQVRDNVIPTIRQHEAVAVNV